METFVAHDGGGGLEIPKCTIYTLEWDFDEQGSPFLKKPYNIIHQHPILRNSNQTTHSSPV